MFFLFVFPYQSVNRVSRWSTSALAAVPLVTLTLALVLQQFKPLMLKTKSVNNSFMSILKHYRLCSQCFLPMPKPWIDDWTGLHIQARKVRRPMDLCVQNEIFVVTQNPPFPPKWLFRQDQKCGATRGTWFRGLWGYIPSTSILFQEAYRVVFRAVLGKYFLE